MTLAGRLKKIEDQRVGARYEPCPVVFEHDAKGELIGASVTRWNGDLVRLERLPGEDVETFRLRAGAIAGDLVSTQAYVLAELRRVHDGG